MAHVDEITAAIDRWAAEIIAYRLRWQNDIIDERRELRTMALELKGLKGRAMTARAHIGRLDAAYEAFNAKAGNHVSDVEGLTEQVGEMADDLSFATAVLGNSVAGSNSGTGEPRPAASVVLPNIMAGVGDLNLPMAAPEPLVGQQTTIHTNRVALGPHPDQQLPASPQAAQGKLPQAGASGVAGLYRE